MCVHLAKLYGVAHVWMDAGLSDLRLCQFSVQQMCEGQIRHLANIDVDSGGSCNVVICCESLETPSTIHQAN